jgi:hypothetical protein
LNQSGWPTFRHTHLQLIGPSDDLVSDDPDRHMQAIQAIRDRLIPAERTHRSGGDAGVEALDHA